MIGAALFALSQVIGIIWSVKLVQRTKDRRLIAMPVLFGLLLILTSLRALAPEVSAWVRNEDLHLLVGACAFLVTLFFVGRAIRQQMAEQERSERQRAWLRNVIDHLPDPVYVKESDGRFLLANQAFTAAVGRDSPDDIIGKTDFDLFPERQARRLQREDQAVLESNGAVTEWSITDEAGNQRRFLTTKSSFGGPGQLAGTIGVTRDISQLKEAEAAARAKDRLARHLVEEGLGLICSHDMEGKILSINPAAVTTLGYRPGEGVGMNLRDFLTPSFRGQPFDAYLDRIRRKGIDTGVMRLVSKSGEERIWLYRNIRYEEQGMEPRVLGHAQDITDFKRAEGALRLSEERFRILFEAGPDAYYLSDLKGVFVDGNRAAEKLTGYSREELIGKNFLKLSLLSPIQVPKAARLLAASALGQASGPAEFKLKRKDGGLVTLEIRTHPVKIGDQNLVLGCARDITERKEAEVALRHSEERFRSVIETAGSAIIGLSHEGLITEWNRQAQHAYGVERAEAMGKNYMDSFLSRKARPLVEREMENVGAGKAAQNFEHAAESREGGETVMLWNLARWGGGKQGAGFILVGQDITELKQVQQQLKLAHDKLEERVAERTAELSIANARLRREVAERKRAEEALRDAEAELRRVTSSVSDYLWSATIDAKGRVEYSYYSPVVETVTGRPPEFYMAGPERWLSTVHPDDRQRVEAVVARLRDRAVDTEEEYRIILPNGKVRWVRDSVSAKRLPDGVLELNGVVSDQTERKRAEEEKERAESQLRHSQKLEAVGVLAAGIAHDFNNILSSVFLFTDLAVSSLADPEKAEAHLKKVIQSSERARLLVRRILAFSRQGDKGHEAVSIAVVVDDALNLLRALLPSTVEIRGRIAPDCGSVLGDAAQLHQIVMNLATNASHAMGESGGVLTLDLQPVDLDDAEAAARGAVRPGPYVQITVTDTGRGIAPEVLDRIFEPFFTTKQVGEGTGLGLSVVHGIVTRQKGAILAESEQGKGARFVVYLPRLEAAAAAPAPPRSVRPSGGSERILLVDDEPSLVEAMRLILENLGYAVTAHSNSAQALDAFRADPTRFDLVLSDVTMPRLTGTELAASILNVRPDVPIVLSTGYRDLLSPQEAERLGVAEVIVKPCGRAELDRTIRRALTRNMNSPGVGAPRRPVRRGNRTRRGAQSL